MAHRRETARGRFRLSSCTPCHNTRRSRMTQPAPRPGGKLEAGEAAVLAAAVWAREGRVAMSRRLPPRTLRPWKPPETPVALRGRHFRQTAHDPRTSEFSGTRTNVIVMLACAEQQGQASNLSSISGLRQTDTDQRATARPKKRGTEFRGVSTQSSRRSWDSIGTASTCC